MQRLDIYNLAENRAVLSGSFAGRTLLATLIRQVSEQRPQVPGIYFLDFKSVEVATASFLRESVLAFRDYARAQWTTLYPIVTNAPESVIEELNDVLMARSDAMVVCNLSDAMVISKARLLGELDPKQRVALDAVKEMGEAEAVTLKERFGDKDNVGATAWNNRLAALAAKGILVATQRGRTKTYRLVLDGIQ